MSGDLEDIGMGVQGRAYTQDFGAGAGTPHIPVAMGAHAPEHPNYTVEYWATWEDDDGPAGLFVETDSNCIEMDRIAGSSSRGGWFTEAEVEDGCVAYRFVWESDDGFTGALPQEGAYQYGAGCSEWVEDAPLGCHPEEEEEEQQEEEEEEPEDEEEGESGSGDPGGDPGGDEPGGDEPDAGDPDDSGGRDDRSCDPTAGSCFGDEDDAPVAKGCSTAPGEPAMPLGVWFLLGLGMLIRRQD
jgi:uncharacterized protein (TIGR03382 family)